jgi:hypothetical protein
MNFRVALSTLAIALSTIGMGVNSTWAGSDLPSAMPPTPISSEVVQPNATKSIEPRTSRWRLAQGVPNSSWRLAQTINQCGPGFTCPGGFACGKAMVAAGCAWVCLPVGSPLNRCF